MVGMYTDQYSSRLGTPTSVTQSLSVCMLEHYIKATECFHCHLSSCFYSKLKDNYLSYKFFKSTTHAKKVHDVYIILFLYTTLT